MSYIKVNGKALIEAYDRFRGGRTRYKCKMETGIDWNCVREIAKQGKCYDTTAKRYAELFGVKLEDIVGVVGGDHFPWYAITGEHGHPVPPAQCKSCKYRSDIQNWGNLDGKGTCNYSGVVGKCKPVGKSIEVVNGTTRCLCYLEGSLTRAERNRVCRGYM